MPRHSFHIRHFALIALASLMASATLSGLASQAGADPIADKQAQAKAIQDQIDQSNREITALGEQYNGAQLALEQAELAVAGAQARIDETRQQVRHLRKLVHERAASVYRRTLSGESLSDIDYSDAAELLSRRKYADAQADRDNEVLDQLRKAKEDLATQKAAAEQARAEADVQRQQITSAKTSLETATAQQQQLLTQVQGEVAQLVEQERKRREAEALAAALERFAQSEAQSTDDGNPEQFPNLPPPGPAAAAAIEWGRTQLGKPYRYAASGPDAYDCSGFTMAAYRAAGLSLPHYSGAQYAMFPHVPLDAMEPGDLVVWGRGGSEHVAIYLGAGRIIESGGSGGGVHIGPIWGRPSGAARPS